MSYEIEGKYRVSQFPPVINMLGDVGARRIDEATLRDTYYGTRAVSTDVFRLRQQSEKPARFTYKSGRYPDESSANLKVREEIECDIIDPINFVRILRKMGYKQLVVIEKFRVTYALDYNDEQFLISLDQLKDIGNFVEIEQVLYSTEDYRGGIPEIARLLGLSQLESRSYMELVQPPHIGFFRSLLTRFI